MAKPKPGSWEDAVVRAQRKIGSTQAFVDRKTAREWDRISEARKAGTAGPPDRPDPLGPPSAHQRKVWAAEERRAAPVPAVSSSRPGREESVRDMYVRLRDTEKANLEAMGSDHPAAGAIRGAVKMHEQALANIDKDREAYGRTARIGLSNIDSDTLVRARRYADYINDQGFRLPRSDEEVLKRGGYEALKQHYDAMKTPAARPKSPTAEKAVETGVRGGRYYVSATGQKVYVKSNPGAEVVGHMSGQQFIGGLPASCHLAEPKKR